jgi:hypothetical protein
MHAVFVEVSLLQHLRLSGGTGQSLIRSPKSSRYMKFTRANATLDHQIVCNLLKPYEAVRRTGTTPQKARGHGAHRQRECDEKIASLGEHSGLCQ